MKHKIVMRLIIFAVVICASLFVGCMAFIHWADSPRSVEGESALFSIAKGASLVSIANSLHEQGFTRSPLYTTLYARYASYSLKAGTYRLSPSYKTSEILFRLHEGKEESVRITIPEGLTVSKTARLLETEGIVSADAFIKAATKTALLAKFSIPASTAEGFLFPDTYSLHYHMDAEQLVSLMISNFFTKTVELPGVPSDVETLYKKVILASIVEREYRLIDEAPLIASVFTNRLAIGMGLQSCATVEYIITELQGLPHPTRLLAQDLEIDSPYNTYLWAGLPPAPISNPGLIALSASFAPQKTNYRYFRLSDVTTGQHIFTRTLDEHVEAGRMLYLKKKAGR